MKVLRLLGLFFLLPLAITAADRSLKIDQSGTFIDVDVDSTVNFTAHLDKYDAKFTADDTGKIKSAIFTFKFADLKTGKPERDAKMIEWLGGGEPQGRFELGNLAVTPDGQGQASGRLTFHDVTERVEFPVNILNKDGTYTITGETTIDYRTWNLKVIRVALLLKVNPEVKIRFKITGNLVAAAAPR
jgi:polyisoprenoid-binding protein YceI